MRKLTEKQLHVLGAIGFGRVQWGWTQVWFRGRPEVGVGWTLDGETVTAQVKSLVKRDRVVVIKQLGKRSEVYIKGTEPEVCQPKPKGYRPRGVASTT